MITLYTLSLTPHPRTGDKVTLEKHKVTDEDIELYLEEYGDDKEVAARVYLNETVCMEHHQFFTPSVVITQKQFDSLKDVIKRI